MKKEKYYLKSIFRTIINKPIQPILIIFIFILSFIVLCINFSLSVAFKNDEHKKQNSIHGSSDIIIKNNSNSNSRFLIKEDYIDILDDSLITGTFNVPLVKNQEIIPTNAIDFTSCNDFFDFEFIEYDNFNISDKDKVIFLYSDYCKKNNIKLNDRIEIECFGVKRYFFVKGISRTPFLGDNSAIIDIDVVLNSLKNTSSYLNLFIENYDVYGTLYIKANSLSIDEIKERILNFNPNLSIEIANRNIIYGKDSISNAISFVMIFLSFTASLAVLLSTIYCINKDRSELSYLFRINGFTKNRLKLYRAIEMAVYSIIGTLIGSIFVYPVCSYVFTKIGFKFQTYEFNILDFIFSFLILLFTSIVPSILDKKEKTVNYNYKVNKYSYILPILDLIIYIILLFINGIYKFYFLIIVLILTFVSIYIFVKPLIIYFAKILAKREKNILKRIGFKNCIVVGEIVNLSKLLILLVTIIVLSSSVIVTNIYTLKAADLTFKSEYLITSATDKIKNECLKIEGIESVNGFFFSDKFTINNNEVNIWATDTLDIFGSESDFDILPINNECYTSITYADKYGLKKGDIVTISHNGTDYNFILKDTYNGCNFSFLLNIDYINENYNYYMLNINETADKDSLYDELTTVVSSEMAIITKTNSILLNVTERQYVYLYFSLTILIIVIIFGSIGIYNNIKQNKMERKEEKDYYIISGVYKNSLKVIEKTEWKYTIIFTLIFTFIISIYLLIASDKGMHTYGGNLIQPLIRFFKIIFNIS